MRSSAMLSSSVAAACRAAPTAPRRRWPARPRPACCRAGNCRSTSVPRRRQDERCSWRGGKLGLRRAREGDSPQRTAVEDGVGQEIEQVTQRFGRDDRQPRGPGHDAWRPGRPPAGRHRPAGKASGHAPAGPRRRAAAATSDSNSGDRAGAGSPRPAHGGPWAGRGAGRRRRCFCGSPAGLRRLPIVEVVDDLVGHAEVAGEAADRLAIRGQARRAARRHQGRLEGRRGLQRRNPSTRPAASARLFGALCHSSSAPWPSQSRVWASANRTRCRPPPRPRALALGDDQPIAQADQVIADVDCRGDAMLAMHRGQAVGARGRRLPRRRAPATPCGKPRSPRRCAGRHRAVDPPWQRRRLPWSRRRLRRRRRPA